MLMARNRPFLNRTKNLRLTIYVENNINDALQMQK